MIWNKLAGGPKKNGSFSRFGRGEEDSNVACIMGKTGDAGSWLVLGAPGTTWDVETDVLLPGVDLDQAYLILASERLRFRHFSAENHALLHANHAGMSIQGNVWIHERGRCQENSVADSTFEGPYHTFILNERPPVYTIKEKSFRIDESWKPWKALTWDAYGYRLSQYIFVKKDRGASLEFRGSFFAGDKFWCFWYTVRCPPPAKATTSGGGHPVRTQNEVRCTQRSGLWAGHLSSFYGPPSDGSSLGWDRPPCPLGARKTPPAAAIGRSLSVTTSTTKRRRRRKPPITARNLQDQNRRHESQIENRRRTRHLPHAESHRRTRLRTDQTGAEVPTVFLPLKIPRNGV